MSWLDEAKKLAAATALVREKVDADAARARAAVCMRCDRLDRTAVKCTVCGCYMKIKVWSKVNRTRARPLGEVTHCPLGKWGDADVANHYRAIDGKLPLG